MYFSMLPRSNRRIKLESQLVFSSQRFSKHIKFESQALSPLKLLPSKLLPSKPPRYSPPELPQSFLSPSDLSQFFPPFAPRCSPESVESNPNSTQPYTFSRRLSSISIPSEKKMDDSTKIRILQNEVSKLKKIIAELQTVIAGMTEKVNKVADLILWTP